VEPMIFYSELKLEVVLIDKNTQLKTLMGHPVTEGGDYG